MNHSVIRTQAPKPTLQPQGQQEKQCEECGTVHKKRYCPTCGSK